MRVEAGWMSLRPAYSDVGCLDPALGGLTMFMLPAYDPAAIAIAGLGILAAAALAFGF
jgi:hypothetical protein